jgi:hypothetical protein
MHPIETLTRVIIDLADYHSYRATVRTDIYGFDTNIEIIHNPSIYKIIVIIKKNYYDSTTII